MNIAFHGLGEMGFAMAGHLARAGHALKVIDLDAARVKLWQAKFGVSSATEAEIIITSVTDAAALRALSASIQSCLKPGMLWIDHTTCDPELARECAALAQARGAAFVEAPMSGGKQGAEEGTLALFVGGAPADVERARLATQFYCAHFAHLGPTGTGQATKLAHQLAIAGTVLGLEAARGFGVSQGIAPADLLDALAHGTARSVQLEQHAALMSASGFDFARGFAWLAKDLAPLSASSSSLSGQLRKLLAGAQATAHITRRDE